MSRRPVREVVADGDLPRDRWPGTLAPVAQLLDQGLELGPVTVLVGENGSGKSTLVEALAMRYGMAPEGGSTGSQHSTRPTESSLADVIRLQRGIGASRRGFFLRAETMHGFYTYLEQNPSSWGSDPDFHQMSHGESFLGVLTSRFSQAGFYLLDEPESALSFAGCLALVGLLHEISQDDTSQAVVATHSPIVAAVPGARIYEVGEWGLRPSTWADLTLVQDWCTFLTDPEYFLRHVTPRD